MKRYAIIYFSTLVILLPLDFVFLGAVGKQMYEKNVGDMILQSPRALPAILFYAIFLAGVVVFVNGNSDSSWQHNLAYGAMFGLFCYSTFALTNMALLKHWEWAVVIPDIAWGIVLTAISAAVGGLLAHWLLDRL